jgi:hypothetical protein
LLLPLLLPVTRVRPWTPLLLLLLAAAVRC